MSVDGSEYSLFDEDGNIAQLPTASKTGWSFAGWKDSLGNGLTPLSIYEGAEYFAQYIDDIAPSLTLSATSNAARKQTVTLTMQDAGTGLASYYVGKIDPATNEVEFKSNENDTLTVEVDDEGTWYFSVKDQEGNITTTPMNFYTISLDADGGTVSTDTIIAAEGSEIELPIPEKEGYTFVEWEKVD